MRPLASYIAVLFLLLISLSSAAQLNQVSVENLTDQQLVSLLVRQNLLGLSPTQLETKAAEAGLSPRQIVQLKDRLEKIDPTLLKEALRKSGADDTDPNRTRRSVLTGRPTIKDADSTLRIFGSDIFDKEGINFEPNLSIPTPSNYVLGVNDELVVDVFGISEATKKLRISNDGEIRYPNFGPIRVVGLTMEQAGSKIRSSLTKIYPAIRSGKTNVAVSLGQIRTIRVTLVGELNKPGSYALPSLSTIMHAVHAAGGPSDIGSYRQIELIRGGKVIATFDLYSFLLKGDLSANVLLQDDDIIKVPAYKKRVAIKGAIKKPAIYDLDDTESPGQLLGYAGGMADIAYKNIVRVKRMGTDARQVLTISKNELDRFELVSGDTLIVDTLANKFDNRVQIKGAIHYPGDYGLSDFTSLSQLLQVAQLKNEALLERGIVRRLKDGFNPEIIQFSPASILKGATDIKLSNNDSVYIYSRELVREMPFVSVNGEVNKPGTYPFAAGMLVADLILTAGGYRDGASARRIEISRRITGVEASRDSLQYAIIKTIDIDPTYSLIPEDSTRLQAFDVINIRRRPTYREQTSVTVEGEVLYPGKYVLEGASETVSDIINRAGGLKANAFVKGAILIRKTFVGSSPSDTTIFAIKSELIAANSDTQGNNQQKGAASLSRKDSTGLLSEFDISFDSQRRVALDLFSALKKPRGEQDLILEEGDILKIPRTLQTVQSFGAVNYPQQVTYKNGMSFKRLIGLSGGFSPNASKRKSYVLEANGKVRSTFQLFGFIRFYPRISPGSEAYIPIKKERNPLSRGETMGITTGLVSLAGVMLAIINSLK
ncbi:MAG: SLBB domain-containing protein [Sphingomonadales bacterium]